MTAMFGLKRILTKTTYSIKKQKRGLCGVTEGDCLTMAHSPGFRDLDWCVFVAADILQVTHTESGILISEMPRA
jgi:hypothetical protein